MKITLNIPDGVICAFFVGIEHTRSGLQLVTYPLSSDDLADGKTVQFPRNVEGADNG